MIEKEEELSTLNFSAKELRCKCPTCKGEEPHKIDVDALGALQLMREWYGKPLALTSAYRCANHPVEAAKDTVGRHRQGIAFDIRSYWGKERLTIFFLAHRAGFRGFGFANSFLHVDFRPAEDATSWGYN